MAKMGIEKVRTILKFKAKEPNHPEYFHKRMTTMIPMIRAVVKIGNIANISLKAFFPLIHPSQMYG